MYKVLLVITLVAMPFNLYSQETYKVTVSSLNVREGGGNKYPIIGVLKLDDEIEVYEISNNWAKISMSNISISNNIGYVNKDYIESTAGQYNWLLILALVVIGWIIINKYKRKCNKCGKWEAMKIVKREQTGKNNYTIEKTKIVKTNGQLREKTYIVPMIITYYDVHRKCKYCNNEDIIKESKKTKNKKIPSFYN